MNVNLYMLGALMLYRVCIHVYSTDIITVDQGRCEKRGMKLMKEVANPDVSALASITPVVVRRGHDIPKKIVSGQGLVIAKLACSKEMKRCRSEVEEAVRMISSTYSSKPLSRNYKAKNSPYGSRFDNRAKCLIAVDALADNVDIWWARNKYPCVIVNESFIFVTHSLFPVRISKGMERRLGDRGGGGGVVGGVGIVCGDGVDRGLGSVDCGVVKAPISAMTIRVPEKDRWCGTRGKFVRWKGVRITKASKRAKVTVRVLRPNTREEDWALKRGCDENVTSY
ncbi:hypothetical protein Tco_0497039 [Tanacetum coccineum]